MGMVLAVVPLGVLFKRLCHFFEMIFPSGFYFFPPIMIRIVISGNSGRRPFGPL
jgi:hypothetical protein